MADLLPYPDPKNDTDDATNARPDHGSPPGAPRWVKVIGIIVIVVVLLFVLQLLLGGGHGPSRHTPSGDTGGHPLSASVAGNHAPSETYAYSVAVVPEATSRTALPSRMTTVTTTRDRGDAQ